MANPQLEDGYLKLANELSERLARANLNGSQHALVHAILRATYGWKDRRSAQLSQSDLAAATGLNIYTVRAEYKRLKAWGVIIEFVAPSFRSSAQVAINKDWEQWGCGFRTSVADHPEVANRPPLLIVKDISKDTLKENPPISPPAAPDPSDPVREVFEHWQTKDHLTEHRDLTVKMRKHALARLKTRTVEELKTAIDRYNQILADGNGRYWLTKAWTFSEFFERREGEWLDKLMNEDWERHFLDREYIKAAGGIQLIQTVRRIAREIEPQLEDLETRDEKMRERYSLLWSACNRDGIEIEQPTYERIAAQEGLLK